MVVTDTQQIDEYYQALVNRKREFVGVFFVGVKTTGIFCIATCRARKPKRSNVEFFTLYKDALTHGYRPCKVCRPTEHADAPPEQVNQAIQLAQSDPKQKVTDYQLRQAGISPEVVRRWFKQHYGLTFHAFQRMFRINHAYQELQGGKRTTDTAFDSGYESLSGFGYTFKKVIGASPKDSHSQAIIVLHRFTTPLGPMFVAATVTGVCLVEFVDRRMLETEFRDLQRLLKARIIVGENQHTRQMQEELGAYFEGKLQAFSVPLHMPGTAFQQSVWRELQNIEYGTTTTYSDLAHQMGRSSAVRAVASANGYNRIAIVVPCHRVIGKDGQLRGYGGGIARKKWLLEMEAKIAGVSNTLAADA